MPGYKLLSRDDLRGRLLLKKITALQNVITTSLSKADHVCFRHVCIIPDLWTSRSVQGFLGIEITFVDNAFTAHMYLLAFTRLTGSYIAARIRRGYDAALVQWNTSSKVTCITIDDEEYLICLYIIAIFI